MIHPKLSRLRKVGPGEPIRASDFNALVEAVQLAVTGPNVQITGAGWLIRERRATSAGAKWVIVRPPITTGGLVITAEDAARHPDYGVAGPNQGRWVGVSELPGTSGTPQLQEYPVWPHRLTDHYIEYAWDGLTVVRESQILLARYVVDAWFIHPDPPFVARRRPSVTIKTPCSPQTTS